MEAVDGNAIGGLLYEVFGTEMTDAVSVCGTCGDSPARSPSLPSTCGRPARSSAAGPATAC